MQNTATLPPPGFMVKSRQQSTEPLVAARRSVTPAGAALPEGACASWTIADGAQACSDTDITEAANADPRIPFTDYADVDAPSPADVGGGRSTLRPDTIP